MPKIIAALLVLVPLMTVGQNETNGLVVSPHVATSIGKPVGDAVRVKMSKEGGTIKSADGRVELIFPEGAILSRTEISIQPISNHASGGFGNAYEFAPSGTKFDKPVQIIFHYRKEDLKGTEARFKNLATQHKDGKWYKLRNVTVDTSTNRIFGSIKHFSSYVAFDEIKISPVQAKLKVGNTLSLVVTLNAVPDDFEDDLQPLPVLKPPTPIGEDDLAPLPTPQKTIPPLKWLVNSIPNGNLLTGTIRISDKSIAQYTAPVKVPDANPVAVTAELKGITYRDNITGKIFSDLTLVSNITIYDQAYQVSIVGVWKDLRREAMGADVYRKAGVSEQIITDSSSFILHLNGNRSTVTNIENMFKDSIINRGKCTYTLMNEAIATGVIHISGIESIMVVPADPPRQSGRGITIHFKKPAIIMPDVVQECKGASINNSMSRSAMAGMSIGFPQTISFRENELKDYWSERAGIREYQVYIRPLSDK